MVTRFKFDNSKNLQQFILVKLKMGNLKVLVPLLVLIYCGVVNCHLRKVRSYTSVYPSTNDYNDEYAPGAPYPYKANHYPLPVPNWPGNSYTASQSINVDHQEANAEWISEDNINEQDPNADWVVNDLIMADLSPVTTEDEDSLTSQGKFYSVIAFPDNCPNGRKDYSGRCRPVVNY